eukprot:jgi/Chrzof1/13062/Cz07g18140.t1
MRCLPQASSKGSLWVLSTRTSRTLTRADVRGEAKQTDRRTRQPANLQSPPHTYYQQAGRDAHTSSSSKAAA